MSINTPQLVGLSTACSGWHQRKHESSTLLAFVKVIHWWLVDSRHNEPIIWKVSPCYNVFMRACHWLAESISNESRNTDNTIEYCQFNLGNGWLITHKTIDVIINRCHDLRHAMLVKKRFLQSFHVPNEPRISICHKENVSTSGQHHFMQWPQYLFGYMDPFLVI